MSSGAFRTRCGIYDCRDLVRVRELVKDVLVCPVKSTTLRFKLTKLRSAACPIGTG